MFITRKRSLGQGNVFTPVCHSVHRGDLHPGGSTFKGVCIQGGLHPGEGGLNSVGLGRPPPRYMGYGQRAGSTHPTGMHSRFTGVCLSMGGR